MKRILIDLTKENYDFLKYLSINGTGNVKNEAEKVIDDNRKSFLSIEEKSKKYKQFQESINF